MAKKIDAYIKLQVPAGQANPSPPVGPALGQHGVNIMEFCKAFNAETQSLEPGMPVPVVISVYNDKSFTFIKNFHVNDIARFECLTRFIYFCPSTINLDIGFSCPTHIFRWSRIMIPRVSPVDPMIRVCHQLVFYDHQLNDNLT